MELPSYFTDFLAKIRPTNEQCDKMKAEHRKLRDLLKVDDDLGPLIIATFIQGSYRRFTANRPIGDGRCDVDVIAATNMHEEDYSPRQALEKFRPFLKEHYPDKHVLQGRSWGITFDDDITLDLVPTSAPSEAEKQAMDSAKAADWNFPDEPDAGYAEQYHQLILESQGYMLEVFNKAAASNEWKEQPLRIPDREAEQ